MKVMKIAKVNKMVFVISRKLIEWCQLLLQEGPLYVGNIQILRNQDFDLFRPHPPTCIQTLLMKQANFM